MPHLHIHSITSALTRYTNMVLRNWAGHRGRLVSSLGVLARTAWRTCQRVERLSDGYLFWLYLCKAAFYRMKRMNLGFLSLPRVSSRILNLNLGHRRWSPMESQNFNVGHWYLRAVHRCLTIQSHKREIRQDFKHLWLNMRRATTV